MRPNNISKKERIRRFKVSGHGSTTKAGKVRQQTPKIPRIRKLSKNRFPRINNRRRYKIQIILNRTSNIMR